MRKLLLIRPEPGLSATANQAHALGLETICCPLFCIEPLAWNAPDPANYDALLITSANAMRHGGPKLGKLRVLPVHAVGSATAAAAREAGFQVETVGSGDVAALLDKLPPSLRLLHLAGEDHRGESGQWMERRIVYRSAKIDDPGLPELQGLVVAVHSPRAGARLAELATDRTRTAVAAISHAAALACGQGWERVESAENPDDNSLLALAAMLCHTSVPE